MIPMTDWQEVKLEDVCIKITDGSHWSPKTQEVGLPMASVKDMTESDIDLSSCRKISKADFDTLVKNDCKPKIDDVLIAKDGSYLKQIFDIKKEKEVVILSSIAIIRPNKEKIIPSFLKYTFKNPVFQEDVKNHYVSGAVIPRIVLKDFRKISFSLPPLDVQRKIAGILGALDDKIEVLREQNKTLEQMAQAVFQSWFVDFDIVRAKAAGLPAADICKKYHITPDIYDLFPSAFSADNLPLGWEKKKLGDLAFNASETHTAQGVEKLIFINTSDVENGAFLHNKYSVRSEMPGQAKKSIKENDILYSEIRPINKHFAFVNFDSKDYIVSTKFMIIRSFDINNVFYIYFFLTLKETLNSFQALAENRSGTFPQITFESISKTEIVFSNRELHWYFSDYLKKTYTKIFENEKQIRTLEQTRDTLLPQLISGKIEV